MGNMEEQHSQMAKFWNPDLVVDDSDDERAARTGGHFLAVLKIVL